VSVRLGVLGWLETVASVEELADVTSKVLLEEEAAAGMLFREVGHIKHKVVENDKTAGALTGRDLIELVDGHRREGLIELDRVFVDEILVENLHNEPDTEEDGQVDPRQISVHVPVYVVHTDSPENGNFTNDNHRVGKELHEEQRVRIACAKDDYLRNGST